ncbi:hypothetical protein NN3_48390 [Nocardia neocaledoniensis NBRC 108232]|uniref:hypothetical protein n=1 Tax=Nocardia neocaledoniensis TaxID=236511 RepID=UPI001191C2B1|nr:hypothetical protein [Nocardia neocaledoniensis]GEM33832.1 hypothetical protein NN3_48390 [Nocardia neocaledoniensis NBRC 108232]
MTAAPRERPADAVGGIDSTADIADDADRIGVVAGGAADSEPDTADGASGDAATRKFVACYPDCVEHSYSSVEFGCFGLTSVLGPHGAGGDATDAAQVDG